ncbi:MAG: ribbon-helix-helix domain-containing protein, partial [Minicystis sp.]
MSNNHVSVRLDAETMARVDALAPLFSTHWRRATRSDILRGLILSALDRYERGPSPPAEPGPAGDPKAASPKKKRAGGRAAK